ncbi:hypothetical protein D3C76_1599750 [compost metagenome]
MQIAAGMQGHRRMYAAQVATGVVGQYVLQQVLAGQAVMLTELLACFDQCRVVFQAGQTLPVGLQQSSPEVAFARTPVEPVLRLAGKTQVAGKRFDLLPLAPGHIDIQTMTCRGQSDCG